MESVTDLLKECSELSCETSCTTSNEGSKNKSKSSHEIIESSLDLMNIPIGKLLKMDAKNRINGSYFKMMVNNISSKLQQTIEFAPHFHILKLKLSFASSFGESMLVAGSSNFLGSWTNPQEMNYIDGCWIKEFKLCEEQSLSKDSSADYFSQVSSSGNRESNQAEAPFDLGSGFEFKFIINKGGEREWESIENRVFSSKSHEEQIKSLIAVSDLSKVQVPINEIIYSYHNDHGMVEISCRWNRK